MTFDYLCKCGKKTSRDYRIGQAKQRVKCQCGKMAQRHIGGGPYMKRVLTRV